MPIGKFQSGVLRTLAAQRSPESYIAGGAAINRSGPRFSDDIDIFHDSEALLEAAVVSDLAALTAAGYDVIEGRNRPGKREATVSLGDEQMPLEWVTDSSFRFFPTQPDDLFGYVLHPVDLATNKASAAADRRVPRDIVDLVTIHESILPLGAVICAAVGRFPGVTPEEMLAEIIRHSRFSAEEFRALATREPIDIPGLHRRIRSMIEDAELFLQTLPSDAIGAVFLDGGIPVQPDINRLNSYQRHTGAPGGLWPTSSEIATAMLGRHTAPTSPESAHVPCGASS